jgi:CheY-like chemotaxis protein
VLDPVSFRARVQEEFARLSRSGGFLSLLAILTPDRPGSSVDLRARLQAVGETVGAAMRAQDLACCRGQAVLAMLPDSDANQALRAARRLLRVANGAQPDLALSAGVATVYRDLEGGVDALFHAAEQAAHETPAGSVRASQTVAGRAAVLVVDDDSAFGQALSETIVEMGWDAFPCTEGADALQRALDMSYQGLFVDLMLRGTNGVEVLKRFLGASPRRPAVLVSGHDVQSGDVLEALMLGPVTFVRKPISRADVSAALEMFRALLPGVGRPSDADQRR